MFFSHFFQIRSIWTTGRLKWFSKSPNSNPSSKLSYHHLWMFGVHFCTKLDLTCELSFIGARWYRHNVFRQILLKDTTFVRKFWNQQRALKMPFKGVFFGHFIELVRLGWNGGKGGHRGHQIRIHRQKWAITKFGCSGPYFWTKFSPGRLFGWAHRRHYLVSRQMILKGTTFLQKFRNRTTSLKIPLLREDVFPGSFVEFVRFGQNGDKWVFKVADFESVVETELSPFFDALSPVLAQNLVITREWLAVWVRRCHYYVFRQIL